MEQRFNVMLFVNNIIFNQACPSCRMCDRINEASKETNEDNAAGTISRQPPKKNICKQPTDFREESNKWKTDEEQMHLIKAAAQQPEEEINEQAKKDKKSSSSGLQQRGGREAFAHRRERERLN